MKVLNGWDAVSGKEGRAYAKIDGNNEELFYAKTIEAKVEKTKSQVKSIGRRMVGHKTTGAEGTGSMTIYYITPLSGPSWRSGRRRAGTPISTW